MKKIVFALAFACSLASAHSASAFRGEPQPNTSVSRTKWVYDLMPRWISSCLNLPAECNLNPNELKILTQIFSSIFTERQNTKLNFISGSDQPGHFELTRAAHRFAVTGNQVGDAIDLDIDTLDSLSMGDLVAILTHELGHHQGYLDMDDRILDQVGSKVRILFESRTQKIMLGENTAHESQQLFVHNSGLPENSMDRAALSSGHFEDYPQIWTLSRHTFQDHSDRLESRDWCKYGGGLTRLGLYDIHADRMAGAYSGSLKWMCSPTPGSSGPSLTQEITEMSYAESTGVSFHFDPRQGPDSLTLGLANITAWSSKKNFIKNGEVWHFEATVESKTALDTFNDCHFVLASESLHESFNGDALGACKVQVVFSVDKNIIRVEGEFKAPEITESRKYYIQALEFRGFHDFNQIIKVIPPIRQGFEVVSDRIPAPLEVATLSVVKTRNETIEQAGVSEVAWKEPYTLRLKTRSSSAFLSGQMITLVHQSRPERVMENKYDPSHALNMSHGLYLSEKISEGMRITDFLRIEAYDSSITLGEHNRVDVMDIDFKTFSWLNTELQEVTLDLKPGQLGLHVGGKLDYY